MRVIASARCKRKESVIIMRVIASASGKRKRLVMRVIASASFKRKESRESLQVQVSSATSHGSHCKCKLQVASASCTWRAHEIDLRGVKISS